MYSIICGKKTVFSIYVLDFSDMEGLLYALTHDILYKGHGKLWILVSVRSGTISCRYQEMTSVWKVKVLRGFLAMWVLVPLTPALFKSQPYHELIIGKKISDYKEIRSNCEDTEIFLC